MNPRFRDLVRGIDQKVEAQLESLLDPNRAASLKSSKPSPHDSAQPSPPSPKAAAQHAITAPVTKATRSPAPAATIPGTNEPSGTVESHHSRFLSLPRTANDVELINGEEEISIGLDWGTHSTKIVMRRGDRELSELLIVERTPDNDRRYPPRFLDSPYPYFAIPSVVGLDAGALRFGDAARALAVTHRCYCLKASLFRSQPDVPRPLIEAIGESTQTDAIDVLAAAFLGWVLGRARESIDKLVGAGNWQPFVAICAPMDRMENADLKRRYEMILHAAVLAAFSTNGPLLSSLRPAAEAISSLRRYLTTPLPDPDHRRFIVAPETVAGLIPLQADPAYSPGLYSLVDIGGGSTELAIVHIVTTGATSIDCLADRSIPIGTLNLNEHKAVPDGNSPEESLAKEASDMWANCYVNEFQRYGNSRGWKKTRVIKAGGGWPFGHLEKLLRKRHASTEYAKVGGSAADFEFVEYSPSTSMIRTAPTMYAPITERRAQFRFLPVAIGLSRYLIWPKNWRPEDRPSGTPPHEPPPSHDATHGHS